MKKIKVLIVDDEKQLAELMRFNFPAEHYETCACYTGKDALRLAREDKPDIMILDVTMGDMSGWEVLTLLKADPQTAAIPVIMCTGRAGPEDIERSFKRGAQSYIMKPIDFPNLLQKVSSLLDLEQPLKRT